MSDPVLAPIKTYSNMSGVAATFAITNEESFIDVVPHMYDTGPSGNIGVRYSIAMIRNPCSADAVGMKQMNE